MTIDLETYLTPEINTEEFPYATYNKVGDCVEFFLSNDLFYGHRIDSLVTVYVSETSGKPVGGLIKGVHAFIKSLGQKKKGVMYDFSGEKCKIEYLLTAGLWFSDDETESEYARLVIELRDAVKETDLEAELVSAV